MLLGEVEKRFREILQDVCDENESIIVALEIMPEHVHLFLNTLPSSVYQALWQK